MTDMAPVEMRCALCGHEETVHVLLSTNQFGSPDLDLRPPPMARDTLEYCMHQCSGCGFVSPDLTEADREARGIVKSPEYQEQLQRPENPPLANRYLARAIIQRSTKQWEQAARACVCAAWACDDEEKTDQARACRERALDDFALWMKHRDFKPTAEAEVGQSLLVIDLNRRAGRFDAASLHCQSLTGRPELKGTALAVWRFQCELIGRRDTACHTIGEAFEGRGDKPR